MNSNGRVLRGRTSSFRSRSRSPSPWPVVTTSGDTAPPPPRTPVPRRGRQDKTGLRRRPSRSVAHGIDDGHLSHMLVGASAGDLAPVDAYRHFARQNQEQVVIIGRLMEFLQDGQFFESNDCGERLGKVRLTGHKHLSRYGLHQSACAVVALKTFDRVSSAPRSMMQSVELAGDGTAFETGPSRRAKRLSPAGENRTPELS